MANVAFGSTTTLSSGTLTFAKSAGQQYWGIQNNDTAPMTLTFKDVAVATLGQIILNSAPTSGGAGDSIDSVNFPMFSDAVTVVVTSTISAAKVSSWASNKVASQIFTGASSAPARG